LYCFRFQIKNIRIYIYLFVNLIITSIIQLYIQIPDETVAVAGLLDIPTEGSKAEAPTCNVGLVRLFLFPTEGADNGLPAAGASSFTCADDVFGPATAEFLDVVTGFPFE
jgi:hypothetical protein